MNRTSIEAIGLVLATLNLDDMYPAQRASSTVSAHVVNLPEIAQLGWSTVEALETHLRFRSFANDWDAPGMEAYDDL